MHVKRRFGLKPIESFKKGGTPNTRRLRRNEKRQAKYTSKLEDENLSDRKRKRYEKRLNKANDRVAEEQYNAVSWGLDELRRNGIARPVTEQIINPGFETQTPSFSIDGDAQLKDSYDQEVERREAIAKQEAMRREAIRREAMRREAARQEAIKKEEQQYNARVYAGTNRFGLPIIVEANEQSTFDMNPNKTSRPISDMGVGVKEQEAPAQPNNDPVRIRPNGPFLSPNRPYKSIGSGKNLWEEIGKGLSKFANWIERGVANNPNNRNKNINKHGRY